jgi:drug/metabolite transporter (DMT)-like permease
MSTTALALVLCAALLHATWNIAAKKAGGGLTFMVMNAAMVGVLWAPLVLWLCWNALWTLSAAQWGFVLATTLVHLGYYSALLTGYRVADLTLVYPVARGTGPLITVLVAVLLLGERPGWLGALGVAAVCGGVFVLAGGPRLWLARGDPRLHAGLRWGGLTGLFIAGYSVLDGYAVKVMLISPILLDWLTNVLRLPVLLPLQWRDWARDRAAVVHAWRTQWRYALVGAVLAPVGYVMVLYALTMAPMSLVSPAREVSLLFAALIGGRLLGEGDRWLRLAGAACIAGGVVLLAWA